MFRRLHKRSARAATSRWLLGKQLKSTQRNRSLRRTLTIERLDDRCMLAVLTGAVSDSLPAPPPEPPFVSTQIVPLVPLEETFFLHSRPTSNFIIYLDFDGRLTQNTPWNGDPNGDPMDPDYEPYIPSIFTPPYSTDGNGQFSNSELANIQRIWARVVEDFAPFDVDVTTEDPDPGLHVSPYIAMHGMRVMIGGSTSDWYSPPNDPAGGVATGAFAGGFDWGVFAFAGGFGGSEKATAEVISHEVGHTLGLPHWGQVVPGEEEPIEYYGGEAGWAPIMGVGYSQPVTTWAKGEYHLATNVPIPMPANLLVDDLATISATLPYLTDDHADDFTVATPLQYTGTAYFGEGVITGSEGAGNNDIDFFSFDLSVEDITFTIDPAEYGPNLDMLVTLYDSDGIEIATFNEIGELGASFSINTTDAGSLLLSPGRYYISIDGTGKPDTTGQGYSDYGSLGYFSINAVRKSHLGDLIGVDFDISALLGGVAPAGWSLYSGGNGPAVLSNLNNESGITTPIDLAISSSKTSIPAGTGDIDPTTLPIHQQPLEDLDGFIGDSNVTWTFTWNDLTPLAVYEVYVFGYSDVDGGNIVQIVSADDPINFTQSLTADQLYVNGEPGVDDRQLIEYTRTIRATQSGTIEIMVASVEGMKAGISGLAIRQATPGSIEGIKWNDLNADGFQDIDEPGLANWTIYIDENNNGILDTLLPQTAASVDVPLIVTDYSKQKSELFFTGIKSIADVNVTVNITHEWNSDVNVYLTSPSGTRVELFTDIGVGEQNFTMTTFDDEATTPIGSGAAPYTGSFRPEGLLSAFDSEDANGIWILEVSDDATNDDGVLLGWSMTVTGSEQFTLTDVDGLYQFANLPSGSYNIREVQQPGWTATLTPPPVTVTSGSRVRTVDFGNTQNAIQPVVGSIAGQKWNDLDGSGTKDPGELGLENWTIYFDANNNGQFDTTAAKTVASNEVPTAIDDLTTVISQLEFHGLASIVDLNITFDIAHTFDNDLDMYLVSPSGTQVALFTGVGGPNDNFTNTTLDDEAAGYIPSGAAPFAGSYRPEGVLSDFDGENPDGIWKLVIRDNSLADEGILNSWSLTIVGVEVSTTTDVNGNYAFNGLVAGDYVVREVQQPGWIQTHAPAIVTVAQNQAVAGVDFGNQALLLGDYNRDGSVDNSDFIVWRKSSGTPVTPYSGADGDGDGMVDNDDYAVWRAHFGQVAPGPGSGSGALLAAGASVGDSFVSAAGSSSFIAAPDSADLAAVALIEIVTVEAAQPVGDSQPVLSPSVNATASAAAFPVVSGENTEQHQRSAFKSTAASRFSADRALLAWLSQSPEDNGAESEHEFGIDFAGDDAETVDAVFETLEECSLVGAGIV